jgi:hypothetical protein
MKNPAILLKLSPFLDDALTERAINDDQDKSKIIRHALRLYLGIQEGSDPMVDGRHKAVRDARKSNK